MRKSKKKILTIAIIVAVVVIAIPVGLYVAGNYYFNDAHIYEETWDFNLPRNIKEEYSAKTPQDFRGEGLRYTVFHYEADGSDFIKTFESEKNEQIETEISAILADLSVSEENAPAFSENYLWKHIEKYDDHLYIVYVAADAKLYLVQCSVLMGHRTVLGKVAVNRWRLFLLADKKIYAVVSLSKMKRF